MKFKFKCAAIEGDEIYAQDVVVESFIGDEVLAWFTEGREDADDWSVLDDEVIANTHVIQLGENVEGDTMKFILPLGDYEVA